MKPGHNASYQFDGQWFTGQIIRIYSSGMVVIDPAQDDRSRRDLLKSKSIVQKPRAVSNVRGFFLGEMRTIAPMNLLNAPP